MPFQAALPRSRAMRAALNLVPSALPPMIDKKEFARRRKQLMRIIGDDAIAIVPAAPERLRNNDSHYPYRQDSDFHYLTGFPEPEAVLALFHRLHAAARMAAGAESVEAVRAEHAEQRLGEDAASGVAGAEEQHVVRLVHGLSVATGRR